MSFALTNAPGTFQLAIHIVLCSFQWNSAIFCLKYIIVFSINIDENMATSQYAVQTTIPLEVTPPIVPFESVYSSGINHLTLIVISRLNIDRPDYSDVIDQIIVWGLTKIDTKTIQKFNEKDPASQEAPRIRLLNTVESRFRAILFLANKHGTQTVKTTLHLIRRLIQII